MHTNVRDWRDLRRSRRLRTLHNKLMRAIYAIVACVLFALVLLVGWYALRMKENFERSEPVLSELRDVLTKIDADAARGVEVAAGKRSYTIDKHKIYLCLRDEMGELYPKNMLVYVLCHEYAHVLNKQSIGHDESFNEVFAKVLARATELGLYDPTQPIIQNYCNY